MVVKNSQQKRFGAVYTGSPKK